MFNIGTTMQLEVSRISPIGAYLAIPGTVVKASSYGNKESHYYNKNSRYGKKDLREKFAKETRPVSSTEEVLLPNNEFKTGENARTLNKGDLIDAFIYLDSEDRPIATLKTPKLTLGGLAILKCKDVNGVGAFLDWGLLKDLFLPFKEQTSKVKPNDEVLVTLYLDKSNRLAASMKVYKLLSSNHKFQKGDNVEGFVYELSRDFGAFVAVDDIYTAMIPKKEVMRDMKVGERLSFRITKVQEDGKIELSMRDPGYLQIFSDCDIIYNELQESKNGFLPYHDKTDSLIIKTKFNMSKNAFKRAIGHLYKDGKIVITEDGIRLV